MSILKYFKPVGKKETTSKTESPPFELPDPSGSLSLKMPSTSIAAANEAVEEVLKVTSCKAKQQYVKITPAQRFEFGKKAAEIGIAQALRFYRKKYPDLMVSEPTARRAKNQYLHELKKRPRSSDSDDFRELPTKKRGRPLLLGEEVDRQVRTYLNTMRGRGCAVNTAVAIGVGLGIARKHGSFITGTGEDLFLTNDWAKSLLHRMGLVKRRVSTKAKVNVTVYACA